LFSQGLDQQTPDLFVAETGHEVVDLVGLEIFGQSGGIGRGLSSFFFLGFENHRLGGVGSKGIEAASNKTDAKHYGNSVKYKISASILSCSHYFFHLSRAHSDIYIRKEKDYLGALRGKCIPRILLSGPAGRLRQDCRHDW
ncbi:MAG: hypothetical protein WAK95_06945, partial [Desulfobacterales bacterium]